MGKSSSRMRSIRPPGLDHGTAPVPAAARVGNVVWSSGISGKDAATGKVPVEAREQVRLAFRNMDVILETAGSGLGDVVRLSITVVDDSLRAPINEEWLHRFPDPDDRPARHITVHDLAHGMKLQLEVIAVLGSE
jgi:2-iminobutanoate/2-iminopropanoate deaminase